MNVEDALAAIKARAALGKSAEMRAYHKVDREYFGTSVPEIDALTKDWRAELSLEARLELAYYLWQSNVHEGRVAAAKLLNQARIRPDDSDAWSLICQWVPDFDAWSIADHVCIAAQKRIVADPARLDEVEVWTTSKSMWVRRAALVATLPYAKLNNLKPTEVLARDRILDWAAGYTSDRDWFMQKVVAWWVRDLSKHDAARAAAFLAEHGPYLKNWARKEAAQYLPQLAVQTEEMTPKDASEI